MKEHLKFALKVAIALFIMNTILSLLGSAGAQIKSFVNGGLPVGSFLGGGSSSQSS